MSKFFLVALSFLGLSFGQNWKALVGGDTKELKIWTDAYMQCMSDMQEDTYAISKEFIDLLKDSLTYKKLLIDGAIPPPKIIVQTKTERNGKGIVKVEKVYFVPVPYEELMKYEYFRRRIEEKKDRIRRYSGFWVYTRTDNLPKPIIGLYKFIAKKEGLDPFVRGKVLVFHIALTEEDAELIRDRLKEKYGIISAIGEVREGREIDQTILSLLMSGGLD